jgi:hypothetical protein
MLKKRKKLKVLKAFKGAQADTTKGQAMSPGTSTSGGVRGQGRDPSAQYRDSKPISAQAKKALASQRKTARETISPSTKKSSQIGAAIAGALASSVIPGSGSFVRKKILADMDKTPYWERDKKKKQLLTTQSLRTNGDRDNDPMILPKTPTLEQNEIPIPRRKVEPYPIKINFSKGGLSGGVKSGPPPKRGPNPQGLKKGGMTCPHRPDGIRGYGAAIKGFKFTGVK